MKVKLTDDASQESNGSPNGWLELDKTARQQNWIMQVARD